MRLSISHLLSLLLVLAVLGDSLVEAAKKPSSYSDNFRIVLDSKPSRGPSIGIRNNSKLDFDAKEVIKKFQENSKEFMEKFKEGTTNAMERIHTEAKDFVNNFKHYNKVEVGIYTALAMSLTVALRSKFHTWLTCLVITIY